MRIKNNTSNPNRTKQANHMISNHIVDLKMQNHFKVTPEKPKLNACAYKQCAREYVAIKNIYKLRAFNSF